jgi:hypothetical protein
VTKATDSAAAQIERYLLGRLPPDEQASVEARLFESEDLVPLVEDAAEHLIDRYLDNDLSPDDRIAFERHFAASRWRQEQVVFRRTLARALPGLSASIPGTPHAGPLGTRAVRLPRRPAAWAAPFAAAALIVIGLGWLARPRTAPTGGAAKAPAAASPRDEVSSADALASPPSPPRRPSLVLRSGHFRSRGRLPRMAVPGGTDVQLDAELDAQATSGQGSARLRNVAGDTLWRGVASIAAGGRRATVILPAAVLQPGDYILVVATGDQAPEDAPTFVFRVVP